MGQALGQAMGQVSGYSRYRVSTLAHLQLLHRRFELAHLMLQLHATVTLLLHSSTDLSVELPTPPLLRLGLVQRCLHHTNHVLGSR